MRRLAFLALLVLALGLPLVAPAGAAAGVNWNCGPVKLEGINNVLGSHKLGCRKARRWTKHIYRSPGHLWEPRRYRCTVFPNSMGGGSCGHKRKRRAFAWAPCHADPGPPCPARGDTAAAASTTGRHKPASIMGRPRLSRA